MSCPDCFTEHEPGPCPSAPPGHEMDYESILETTDTQLLTIIESVLKSAGIPFVVQGQEALSVFPVGVYGSGERMHGLGATIHVPKDLAEEARELLETVASGPEDEA